MQSTDFCAILSVRGTEACAFLVDTYILVQFFVPVNTFLKKGGEILFFEQLKRVCEEKGTSPSAVALAAGMSKSNVTNWSSGQSPTLDTVLKLAAQLGVDPSELIPKGTT